jgi:hypothetical protein
VGSKLSTGKLCGVDVEIRQAVFDSSDQRRLGLLEPALRGDKGRIEERRIFQTKDWREVGPLSDVKGEPGKRWQRRCDADGCGIARRRLATMDVRRRI